jgi:ABC-type branched-subunit amino acid transport system substrate-binding protein
VGTAPTSATGLSPAQVALPEAGKPVKIGFFVSADVGKALATFGLGGLSSGDGATQAKAATDLVNGVGGLDGHRIVPVVYVSQPTTDQTQAENQQQAACEAFFTDDHVAAVVSVLPAAVLNACTHKHGVPLSVSSISTLSRADLTRYPNVVMPNQIERDHGISVIVPALKRAGYFTPRGPSEVVKAALVTNEAQGFEKVPAEVKAELTRNGFTLYDYATMSTADRAAAEASSAVLRFQAEGITHVISIDDHGGAMTFFLLAAQSQGYYPRIGLSSYSIPQIAADVLPARQFQDAVGVGWLPTFDVGLNDADKTVSAPGRQCMTAMAKAGEDMANSGSRGIALGVCDSLLAMRAAVQGRGLALPSYLSGLRRLGRTYVSTLTFSTDFASRRDGADLVRLLGYDAACTCFHYTSGAFRP